MGLYAWAIFFTYVVGKGYMFGGDVPDEAEERFGSTARSLLSLFKLMNGDIAIVQPITEVVFGQLIFATFMVISNWSILAVLTSVVSDNMISTSQAHEQELQERRASAEWEIKSKRLRSIFHYIDIGRSGTIREAE